MRRESTQATLGRVDVTKVDRGVFFAVSAGVSTIHVLGVGAPSYWYDEAATLRLARLPLDDFFSFVAERDAVHALYVLLMHYWIFLFGESEFAVRALSVIATGFAAGGVYLLSRRFGATPIAAVFGAAVFALLPRIAVQAAEARSYALAVALLVGAALLFLRWLRVRSVLSWACYFVVATLAAWCFAYSVLVLPAFALFAVVFGDRGSSISRRLAGTLAPVLAAIPLLVLMFEQRDQVAWLSDQAIAPSSVLIEPLFVWALWMAIIVTILLALGFWRGVLPLDCCVRGLVAWLLLPPFLVLLAGLVVQPIFTPRYFSICAPALAILCALAVRTLSTRLLLTVGVIWTLGAVPFFAATREPSSKPGGVDYRLIAETVAETSRPGEIVLFGTEGVGALRPRVAIAAYPSYFSDLQDIALTELFTTTGTFWDTLRSPEALDLSAVDTVWLVDRAASIYERHLLDAGLRPVLVAEVTGVEITRWSR